MFKGVDFAILRGRYVKAAMDEIASFRPDGKTPAEVQTLIDTLVTADGTFVTKSTTLDLARG